MTRLARVLAIGIAILLGMAAALAAQLRPGSPLIGSSYIPPPILTPLAIAFGDSITGNSGSVNVGGTSPAGTFTTNAGFGNGYPGWLQSLSGMRVVEGMDYNFGNGSTTTASGAGRIATAQTDCNWSGLASTLPCFTGRRGTIASIGVHATTMTYTPTSGGPPVAGDTISVNGINYGCIVSGTPVYNSGPGNYTITIGAPPAPGTTLAASGCVTSTTSGTITLSPIANTSGFQSWIGPSGVGSAVTDIENNPGSTGQYSPVTDPAQLVFLMYGTNDGGITLPQSLINLGSMLDAYKGTNKRVVLHVLPRGLGTGFSTSSYNNLQNGDPETGVVDSGTYTYTVSQSANYWATSEVFYTPAPVGGLPFTAGANFGKFLINCTTLRNDAPAGTLPCTPASGYYSVSSSGVYTFNSADASASPTVSIYYTFKASNLTAGVSYLKTIYDWENSSASSFSENGQPYYLPGALYKRPWVIPAGSWSAMVDPSTTTPAMSPSTQLNYPLPYMLGGSFLNPGDGLHPPPAGGATAAYAALLAAYNAGAISSAPAFALPALNNVQASTGNSYASGTVSSPVCFGDTYQRDYIGVTSPAASTGVYGNGSSVTTPTLYLGTLISLNGGPVSTGIVTIDCVDQGHNLLHIAGQGTSDGGGSGSGTAASQSSMVAAQDPNSFLFNGLFSEKATPTDSGTLAVDSTTLIAGCSTGSSNSNCGAPNLGGIAIPNVIQGFPKGWGPAFDSASVTAIPLGTSIGANYGMELNPFGDGDDFILQVTGKGASNSGSFTMTQGLNTGARNSFGAGLADGLTGDYHRAWCQVRISAGPGGHLLSFKGVQVKTAETFTSSTPTNAPGVPSSNATWYNGFNSFIGEGGGGSLSFSDWFLNSGVLPPIAAGWPGVSSGILTMPILSTPSRTAAAIVGSGSGASMTITVAWQPKDVVDFTVRINRCAYEKVSQ